MGGIKVGWEFDPRELAVLIPPCHADSICVLPLTGSGATWHFPSCMTVIKT